MPTEIVSALITGGILFLIQLAVWVFFLGSMWGRVKTIETNSTALLGVIKEDHDRVIQLEERDSIRADTSQEFRKDVKDSLTKLDEQLRKLNSVPR